MGSTTINSAIVSLQKEKDALVNEHIMKVIDAIVKSQCNHIVYGETCSIITHDLDGFGQIGVQFRRYSPVWHWFRFQMGDVAPFISYDYSYNQADGSKRGKRSWDWTKRVMNSFERKIGIRPEAWS